MSSAVSSVWAVVLFLAEWQNLLMPMRMNAPTIMMIVWMKSVQITAVKPPEEEQNISECICEQVHVHQVSIA